MRSAEHNIRAAPAVQPWREVVLSTSVVALAVASLCAWLLPAEKPGAIFGRLSYSQAVVAVCLSALFVAVAVLLLSPACCRRRRAFRMAAAGIGVSSALVVAECLAWLLPIQQPHDNPWYAFTSGAATLLEESDELMIERPSHVSWQGPSRGDFAIYKDYHDPYARTVVFRTDHEGFRNSVDMDRADIVFIGDSHTEAGNMPESETFVARTGAALGVRERNLGRACHSPSEELIILKRFGLSCQPDLVVWQFCENNDLDEEVRFREWIDLGRPRVANLHYDVSRLDTWKRRSPTYRLFARLRQQLPWEFRGTFRDAQGFDHPMLFEKVPTATLSPLGHPGWSLLAESLKEGATLLKDRDIDLIVVHIPKKLRVMGHCVRFNQHTRNHMPTDWDLRPDETLAWHLAQQCNELNILFLDATPVLKERAAEGAMVYLPMDSHLSSQGHAVVSELLVDAITNLDPPIQAVGSGDHVSASR